MPLDPDAATRAYLATVPADVRARSDAYTEGGYWIQVWGFLLSAAILILLLRTGLSRRLRDWAERRSRRAADPDVSLLRALHRSPSPSLTLSVDGLHRLRARARLRARHPGLRRLAAGSARRARRVAGAGRPGRAVLYEVLRRFPRAWPALGAAVTIGVRGDRRADRAGLHRAAVQPIHPADRRADPRPDPPNGARQRHRAPTGST